MLSRARNLRISHLFSRFRRLAAQGEVVDRAVGASNAISYGLELVILAVVVESAEVVVVEAVHVVKPVDLVLVEHHVASIGKKAPVVAAATAPPLLGLLPDSFPAGKDCPAVENGCRCKKLPTGAKACAGNGACFSVVYVHSRVSRLAPREKDLSAGCRCRQGHPRSQKLRRCPLFGLKIEKGGGQRRDLSDTEARIGSSIHLETRVSQNIIGTSTSKMSTMSPPGEPPPK